MAVVSANHRSAARMLALLCSTALAGVLAGPAWSQTSWTGAVSEDWFEAGNWSNLVPDASDNVNIDTATPNSPVINGGDAATGWLLVSQFGIAELRIVNGGTLSSTQARIGNDLGSQGSATVSGPGSAWSIPGDFLVGTDGIGSLTITDGGAVTSGRSYIGVGGSGDGTVNVTGADSVWNVNGPFVVGNNGEAELKITDGGSVVAPAMQIASAPGSQGRVAVDGSNSTLLLANRLTIGAAGDAALTAADGGTVSATQITIAGQAGSVGTLNIGAAAGDPAAAPGTIDTPLIILGEGDGTINFKHTASSYVFTPSISGAGTVNVLLGPTIFTGENTYTGTTNVIAGATLQIGNGGNTGSLASDAVVNGALTFDRTGELTYAGAISGSGRFSKRGSGTLTLTSDNEIGIFTVRDGTLAVDGGTFDQPDYVSGRENYVGESTGDDAALLITNGGKVSTANSFLIGNSAGSKGSVIVEGDQSRLDIAGGFAGLSVGFGGDGTLSVTEGGHVSSLSFLNVGGGNWGQLGNGLFSIDGAGSSAEIGTLTIAGYGDGSTGAVTVSDGGVLNAHDTIRMSLNNTTGSADLNIGAASTNPADAVAPGTLHAPEMDFYNDSASLNFNHTGDAYVFDTPLVSMNAGDGFVLHYAGVTSLTGDSSGFSGDTIVHGGTLKVNGTLGGMVDVESGGTLGGSGTIGGNVTVDGTLSAGNSPGTLTIDGDLALNSGSTSIFELNTPGVVGGVGNDLVNVHNNLTLGGALDARVAAAGYYRLFNYDGTLTGTFDSGTLTGTGGFTPLFPNSPDIRYDTPHQVNLSVLAAGQTMLFWDGTNTTANGTVDGGDGTWNSAGDNWTDSAGGANGSWGGTVGVFAGSAGTVTVDGTQSFDTLQFKTDDYELTGGTLALSPATGTTGTLNIDNGVSTTIASTIADGTGNSLKKVGGGTLVLKGSNTYTGGTQLFGGTVSVSSDANLGDASGDLTFDGGTLRNTADLTTARNITLDAGGGTFQADADLALNGMISGAGSLTKAGAGVLTLSNASSYDGGTTISQGQLTAAATGALSTGAVDVKDSAALAFINDNTSAGTSPSRWAITRPYASTMLLRRERQRSLIRKATSISTIPPPPEARRS
ncbi:beta strand repeat-containing protein [Mesorhizobium koreense]|uniref:beta strand repeat-containing protein n=1 Tax=Mesorhizobium koreense TaxID=3074855 RepID=UPI00287B9B8E|nr:autotransporter-associated beta strand repeat-containing protein [Mesorhizobium sp. WR6]